jgi:gliding motility-associated-like protein
MRRSLLILIIVLFASVPSSAQQNNNWYFGKYAAISFNAVTGQPVPHAMHNSVMNFRWCSATASDKNGDLLFYTNGDTVYNRLHKMMLNGYSLGGSNFAKQISIVPMPGNDKLFYIFTTGSVRDNFSLGYHYSIVDMNGDNGNGEVITKNNLLFPSCTDRLTAVRHANGIDVWLITNDNTSNIFRSWLITCNGLQALPVVSSVGVIMNQHPFINQGYMKVSPDGKLLCQTHVPYNGILYTLPEFFQLFDFDNSSGIISNPRYIDYPGAQVRFCAFSPDSKLLYMAGKNLPTFSELGIDQLEVTLPTVTDIVNSNIHLLIPECFDLQLAADNKIYITGGSATSPTRGVSLAVINKPDVKGSGCNYREGQVSISPDSVFLALPSCINDISSTNPANGFSYTILDSCSGTVQFNANTTMAGTITWLWDFGDGSPTSSLQNPFHIFTPADQLYNVTLKVTASASCADLQRSKVLRPSGMVTTVNFDFVKRCDSGYVRFINKSPSLLDGSGQFLWDFGDATSSSDINPIHSYAIPGTYQVKLSLLASPACLSNSMTQPVNLVAYSITVSPDQTITVGQFVSLFANAPPVSFYQWSPATWLNNSSVSSPVTTPLEDIVYKLTATNSEGCKSEDSVFIHVLQYDDVYVPTGFTPNNDGKNDELRPYYSGKLTMNEFTIYDRWGIKIFSTSQKDKGWNGKINGILQNTGVYVWIFNASGKDGAKIVKKGSFVLIR